MVAVSAQEISWDYRAPNIALAGVTVLRTMVQYLQPDEAGEIDETSGAAWRLTGVVLPDALGNEFGVVGDLYLRGNGWELGTTAMVPLAFRDSESLEQARVDQIVEVLQDEYAEWCSYVLWDVVAATARSLVALTGCPIEVPRRAPAPVIGSDE